MPSITRICTTLFVLICAGAAFAQAPEEKSKARPAVAPSSTPGLAEAAATLPPEHPPADKPGRSATVFAWDQLDFKQSTDGEHLLQASIFHTPTRTLDFLSVHTSQLAPGRTNHPAHRHDGEDEVVMILEGTLEVYINGTTQVAGPRSVLLFMQNDWHRLKNVGKETARYVLFHIVPVRDRGRKVNDK